jgi:glycogen synthase
MATTILDQFDRMFAMRLEQWSFLRRGLEGIFDKEQIGMLLQSEQEFPAEARTVVLLAFENRFASLGGLTPVMKYLPRQLIRMGERVMFLSPFHCGNQAMKAALKDGLFDRCFARVPFRAANYEALLTCYRDTTAAIPSWYLEIPGRFTAGENPYGYADQEELLLDALAFTVAVPFALAQLGFAGNLLFHAHEWETAAIAVTAMLSVMQGRLRQVRTVLTLHNSFDCRLSAAYQRRFFGKELRRTDTVLQCAIPLLNGPLVTVSTPFARELCCDPLQRSFFADHLQEVFSKNPPAGIENGVFGDASLPFTDATLQAARRGAFEKLLTRKLTYRRRFLKILERGRDGRSIGKLAIDSGDTATPVFFMAGRLDFMQKGFDVMFYAFERLRRGQAKLLFCPSGTSGITDRDLAFFKKIALRCAGDIEIWPFKIPRRVYDLFLKGASFLLMPSLYEPFGSANEGLLSGTPIVARGTGGLWIQVNSACPVTVPPFYGALRLDGKRKFPTGILFRETYPDAKAGREWRRLLELPPAKRRTVPLFGSIVRAAGTALNNAIGLYAEPKNYAQLIVNGLAEVKKLSWERAAGKYLQVYDVASTRGR